MNLKSGLLVLLVLNVSLPLAALANDDEKKIIIVSSLKEALAPKVTQPKECVLYLSNPTPSLQNFLGDFALKNSEKAKPTIALLQALKNHSVKVTMNAKLEQPFFFDFEKSVSSGNVSFRLNEIQISLEVVRYLTKNYLEAGFTLSSEQTGAEVPADFKNALSYELARYEMSVEFANGSLPLKKLSYGEALKRANPALSERDLALKVFEKLPAPLDTSFSLKLLSGDISGLEPDLSALEQLQAPDFLFDIETFLTLGLGAAPSELGFVVESGLTLAVQELRSVYAQVLYARKFFVEAKNQSGNRKALEAASLLFMAEWRFQSLFLKIQTSLKNG